MLKMVALYMIGELLLEIVVFFLLLTVISIISNFSLTQIMGCMVNMAESAVVKYTILAV